MVPLVAFQKYEGLGNDFILVEAATDASVTPRDAVEWCDRRFGVGADGVLLMLPASAADARMRVINSDGSIAEMCGNGLRCAALHLAIGRDIDRGEVVVETDAGLRRCAIERHGEHAMVVADMGRVSVLGESTLLLGDEPVRATRVDAGNPHAVVFRRIGARDLDTMGGSLSAQSGANIEFAWANDGVIEVLVWERGAGATLACGTGACAVVAAFHASGRLPAGAVRVRLPGGELEVTYDPRTGATTMRGPARRVFSGSLAKRAQ